MTGRPPNGDALVVDDVAAAFADVVVSARPRTIALSGGSTARRCYQALAGRPDVPWPDITALFGDERWVPVDHPDSNEGMARRVLLDGVPVAAVHSLREAGGTPAAAAAAYDDLLGRLGPIDVVHLGLGEDGHTASLFPGSPALAVDDRLVVATGDDRHDHERVTVTFPAIARSRLAVVTVSGPEKAEAWSALCGGEDVPAARVEAERLLWLIDPTLAGAG